MKYGDRVTCRLEPGAGLYFVIGEMSYSAKGNVILLATPEHFAGMPINSGWCDFESSGHEAICAPLRERYLAFAPNGVKPLPFRCFTPNCDCDFQPGSCRGVPKVPGEPVRRRRLMAVFEGRRRQLIAARATEESWPPTPEQKRCYSRAVIAYTRARMAWRRFRGWT